VEHLGGFAVQEFWGTRDRGAVSGGNGLMTEGYALIAWPERYGDTGVMSFIVNRDGVVYQKNLGPATDAAARQVMTYNPDASWSKVKPSK
jgi:hypothetical protein